MERKRRGSQVVGVILGALVVVAGALCFAEESAPVKNPFAGSAEAVQEGKEVFATNCSTCHGDDAKGNMCPDITVKAKRYGNADADLFLTITKGRPGGMPTWEKTLGTEKIWKVIAFLRSIEEP